MVAHRHGIGGTRWGGVQVACGGAVVKGGSGGVGEGSSGHRWDREGSGSGTERVVVVGQRGRMAWVCGMHSDGTISMPWGVMRAMAMGHSTDEGNRLGTEAEAVGLREVEVVCGEARACGMVAVGKGRHTQRDHVTTFTSRLCATGWHTHVGRAWETVDTLYEHV